MKKFKWFLLTSIVLCHTAYADTNIEIIRKNLGQRIGQLEKINEIKASPMPGLYEIRVNQAEIYYTDARGDFLIQGNLIDTQRKLNLTEERIEKLTAIEFKSLPFKDAISIVRGDGKRQLAVFEDPNCGYCKKFERDIKKINNITVHLFLVPILGPDSVKKSKDIWCAKDPAKAWQTWMIDNKKPTPGECDTSALDRNVALSQEFKINGTPTLIFSDGSRVPGAISSAEVEKRLNVIR